MLGRYLSPLRLPPGLLQVLLPGWGTPRNSKTPFSRGKKQLGNRGRQSHNRQRLLGAAKSTGNNRTHRPRVWPWGWVSAGGKMRLCHPVSHKGCVSPRSFPREGCVHVGYGLIIVINNNNHNHHNHHMPALGPATSQTAAPSPPAPVL